MDFLASKRVSLFCAILNLVFAAISVWNGSVFFFLFNIVFSAICFYNWRITND